MNIALFCHSIVSDYNYSVAHFLRGLANELQSSHQIEIFEKEQNESLLAAIKDFGKTAVSEFQRYYPTLKAEFYIPTVQSISEKIQGKDLVIVHSATDSITISILAELKRKYEYHLILFDDCYHIIDHPELVQECNLFLYDLILVNSQYLLECYKSLSGIKQVNKLPYAIDMNVFQPRRNNEIQKVAVLNLDWINDEQLEDIEEFFIKPVKDLRIEATTVGTRYTRQVKKLLTDAGIEHKPWVPSFKLPEFLSTYMTLVHIPSKNSSELRAGISSMNLLEEVACGIPVITKSWINTEGMLTPGRDYLQAADGYEMKHYILEMMNSTLKEVISDHGVRTIKAKHTCKHRSKELNVILQEFIDFTGRVLVN
jgi:spore maturation protein CgeB